MTRVRGDDELLELLVIMGADNGEQDATTPAETYRDTRCIFCFSWRPSLEKT